MKKMNIVETRSQASLFFVKSGTQFRFAYSATGSANLRLTTVGFLRSTKKTGVCLSFLRPKVPIFVVFKERF